MVKRSASCVLLLLLGVALPAAAQLKLADDNVEMKGNALLTMGYNGSYGDESPSTHSINYGLSGNVSGSYYNPNFFNFNISPYLNQSEANSDFKSLTSASGVNATVNLFSGSHFPGSVNYSYTHNNTTTQDLVGVPNFTSVGNGQGFGISWSALLPDWPTLTVGYSQGSGSGNVFGTDEETKSDTHNLNVRSSYDWRGFRLGAFYTHQNQESTFPLFLSGENTGSEKADSVSHSNNLGFSGSHSLPWHGQFFSNFSRSWFSSEYQSGTPQINNSNSTSDYETTGVSFHPTTKLTLSGNESYTNNLSGYLTQNLINNGNLPPEINLGSSSYSFTFGGGASYAFMRNLYGTAQATHYIQHYFGNTYTGTYVSGTANYNKKLLNTFTFSASVVDSANGQGHDSLGFVGTLNGSHWIGPWDVSGFFSYSQNVQSALITYTTSSYNYSANVHRRWANRLQWTVAFNGSHSGLTQDPNTANHAESYGTTLSYRRISAGGSYTNNGGYSLLGGGGLIQGPPLPGETNLVIFSGHGYGGNFSVTPLRRMTVTAAYSRSFSNTLAQTLASRNNTTLAYGQLRYRLRRIELLAGFTQLTQGISVTGMPANTVTSYYGGVSRWFDLF